MDAVGYIDIALYSMALVFWLYNCYWLLYQKGRWHNEQIFLFYSFGILIIIARILNLIIWDTEDGSADMWPFYTTSIIANYSWMCLGVCQVLAIIEISLRLK